MINWTKKLDEEDAQIGARDYKYRCGCGNIQGDEEYNADTGHYECMICGCESQDLENIENATNY